MSISNMYRVSDMLRSESRSDGFICVLEVKEQCGHFYYFRDLESAIRATRELGSGIDVMPYRQGTNFSDDLF